MKKSKVEAAETRERIIQSAAVAFRRNGIHATGLAEIMAAAGLTQGGFYRHFGSKDELVAEVCAEAMSSVVTVTKSVRGDADGETGLQAIVGNFLSLDHRDNQLEGCPLVGLGIELARADEATRAAASDGFVKLVDLIARQISPKQSKAARSRAIFALSAMVGAVTMARVCADPELSAAILQETKAHLAKLL